MHFDILALRPIRPATAAGIIADLTLGYADLTIVGARLGLDDFGRPFVAFPKVHGQRSRIHCKDSGTRRRMVEDAIALYRAMIVTAETPLAKASSDQGSSA